NYTCLSGEGWIPDLPIGSYIAVFNTEYAEFQRINRTITITIPNVRYSINVTSLAANNKTVNITAKSDIPKDILWEGKLLFILPNGTQIDAIYGANGTWWVEHTFDDYGEYNVNATYVGLDNVTVNNGTITINKVNSTIALDNIVLDYGESANVTVTTTGATGITANINGTDVTVINNYTIPISGLGAGNYILTVTTIADDNHNPVTKEVTITVNKVSTEITLANETLDLKVNDEFAVLADLTPAGAGNLTYSSSNESVVKVSDEGLITALSEGTSIVTVSFAGNDNYTVAQNKTINVTVSLNDASVSAEDITLDIGANATIGAVSVPEGLKVTYIPDNSGVVTVENGVVTAVKEGTAKITLKVGGDGIYAENSTTITVTVNKINATVDVLILENVTVGDNSTVNVVLPEDATGNVTVKVDGEVVDTVPVKDGSADVTIPSMSAGNHTVNVSYSGDDNYKSSSKTATLSVAKDSTNLTAANVTATYNINKYLVITLKDSKGNPLANSTVTVDLNGAKNYTTDENGQVKVKVSNLVPKTYSAKITFDGNGNYLGSDATAKVVVKKATPKITANAKTFKTTTKTKKYTITLKDNTGKAIKNAKVYLKVNGKTYKATTNSKGKATFKITKLDKKGTFKATITYKGSKYYNNVTKKANIKVISTWKTISKGSKLKSTVKEIQRALKNNGYYLTAYGHYLMVDGIYWDHTVNAVKQFQKAKGLKVTGKVDEKTAKKLGII
ncbi:MAG: Ig-like domain repeat protein, partial [Methanobrevibacter sp.]|nr:Ig-like domain repeat protein [Methanobrevibacter sp.]